MTDKAAGETESAREAIEALFRAQGTRLLRLAALYLEDMALAEDAVQETYLKVYKNFSAFRGESDLATWAMRVCINTCKDMRRSAWFRGRKQAVSLDSLPEPAVPVTQEDQEVLRAVLALPGKYREVLLLHYWQGIDARNIAYALGISEAAVYTRLSRARARLKPILEGGFEDEQPHQAGI
ncbi:MAG: sigma-70 family RNA polymerase sigma factor [Clostridiales bacterium]|nr:sigma-70 family RNA polymerase sigma factor [Clostridiales bacterium]